MKRRKSKVSVYRDGEVPVRKLAPWGMSLAPWRRFLEENELVREYWSETVYPVDRRLIPYDYETPAVA